MGHCCSQFEARGTTEQSKMETMKMSSLVLAIVCISVDFANALAESSCPCEKEIFDVTVKVDPAKSPNTKQVALDVYQNVYTSASTFMKKQGMDLRTFVEESNFVNEDESCYRGVLRGGQFKLPEGTGLATVAFRLTSTDDTLSATGCLCAAIDDVGRSVCEKGGKLHQNLKERLSFVKQKLEGGANDAN